MSWIKMAFGVGLALGSVSGNGLILLPMDGDLEKTEDMAAINRLFRDAVEGQYKGQMLPTSESLAPCSERDCAVKAAQDSKADEAIYSSLHRLGSKWVFSATVLNSDGSKPFSQRLTATSIEDMEAVTKRVADAILNRKNIEQVASLDNITEKEEAHEPTRRRSLYSGGFALGYLFPVDDSYALHTDFYNDTTFTTDTRLKHYSQLIRLSWMNSWEFRDNLLLNADFVWAAPHVIGGDINMNYLLTRTDYSPFLGGGLGLHYVVDPVNQNGDKRQSGPSLNVQGGMMLFRTYDVHVMMRGQYQMIFNSDLDHGFAADVGVTFRKRPEEKKESGWGSFWKYYLLGALFLSIVGASVN